MTTAAPKAVYYAPTTSAVQKTVVQKTVMQK
jgi:hypothetical protein